MVVPSRRYRAGGLKSFLLGDQYRDLWSTPIRVDVLDLKTFAGGLTVDRAGGAGQSLTLHMRGADGRSYVFRTVDKELTVPVGFENTFAESFMQDMKVKGLPSRGGDGGGTAHGRCGPPPCRARHGRHAARLRPG